MGKMSEIKQIRDEVCQEHCKHYQEVMEEGYTEDAFFDRLADLYCNDCPLDNLDEYVFTCNDCASKDFDCKDCPAFNKGYDQACCDMREGEV